MFNLLKSDVYRLVHGKMLWVGLAFLALVVVGAAGLVWFATTPEFAQMVNEQAQEEARQSGATVTITSPNGAGLDAEEVQALNEKVISSRTYSYGNTFMVGFLGLILAVLAALLASSDFDTGFAKNVLAGRGDRSRGVDVVARGADWGSGGGVGGHGNLPGAGFQMLLHWTPERFE